MAWTGSDSRRWRAYFSSQLPVPCLTCGRPVTAEDRWHVGHILDRALGGENTVDNLWPEHGVCNERKGGQLGRRRQIKRTRVINRVERRLPSWLAVQP